MRQAIGYIRVSTQKQATEGRGMDLQRAQIDAFAERCGYRIRRVYGDVASGMGDDLVTRVELLQAILEAKKNQWPIIVAGLDRVARNTKKLEEIVRRRGVSFISAELGEGADPAVVHASAVRAQYEGELISRRTSEALAERKAKGVKLGNRTNLAEAQSKGAQKNRALAKHRSAEFEEMVQLVKMDGAKSVDEISAELNRRGFRTARGCPWKISNLHRMLKKIGAGTTLPHAPTTSPKRVPSSLPKPVFNDDGYLLPDGVRRVRQIMEHRKIKMGEVMRELGRSPLDPSLGIAPRHSSRFNEPKLLDWVLENERTLGLS